MYQVLEVVRPEPGVVGGTYEHVNEFDNPRMAHLLAIDLRAVKPENRMLVVESTEVAPAMELFKRIVNPTEWPPVTLPTVEDHRYFAVAADSAGLKFRVLSAHEAAADAHRAANQAEQTSPEDIHFVIRSAQIENDLKILIAATG